MKEEVGKDVIKDMTLGEISARLNKRIDFLRPNEIKLAVNIMAIAMADALVLGKEINFKKSFKIRHKLRPPRRYQYQKGAGKYIDCGHRFYVYADFPEEYYMECNFKFWEEEVPNPNHECASQLPKLKKRAYYEISERHGKEIMRVTDDEGVYIPRRGKAKINAKIREERMAELARRERVSNEFNS